MSLPALGRRLGGEVPKQYRNLGGVPMLLRALRPFTAHPDVAFTVVALPPGDEVSPPGLAGGSVGRQPSGLSPAAPNGATQSPTR